MAESSTSRPDRPPQRRPWRRRAARAARWLLVGAAALLLVVVSTLALPAGRQFLLRAGLDLVDRELPGELSVGALAWSRLGELTLDDVLWAAGVDTLATVERLHLRLSLTDLWRRDLTVDLALAAGVTADLPAIEARLAVWLADADTAAAAREPGPPPGPGAAAVAVPWLREGALPRVPSVAVHELSLARVAVATRPEHTAHLDRLAIALDLRHGRQAELSASVRARPLPTLGLSWRLRGTVTGDTLDLALAPLHLAAPARLPADRELPLTGRLRLPVATLDSLLAGNPAWPSLQIDELILTGDLGDWRLDAHLDGRAPGRVSLHSEMPAAPVALLAGLASLAEDSPLTAAAIETLAHRWGDHRSPGIDLAIDLQPPPRAAPAAPGLQARGRLRLPAPAAIAPLLPPELMVDDLGPLELDLTAVHDGSREPAALALDLDLERTLWLDRGRVSFSGNLHGIDRGEVALALPGLVLSASGHGGRDDLHLDLTAALPDAALLRRWRDPSLADLDLQADLSLQARGSWALPRADLQIGITARQRDLDLPRAVVTATLAADTLHAIAALPQGLQSPPLAVSELELVFAGAPLDSLRALRGQVSFAAAAAPLAVAVRGRLDADALNTSPAVSFVGEHLSVSLDRRTLTSTGPWRAAYTAADSTACLSSLQLAGSLGHLTLDGCLGPDSLRADVELELRLLLDAVRTLLPAEHQAHLPTGTMVATGQATARGHPGQPWINGDLELAILDQPELAGLGADLALALAGTGPAPADLPPGRLDWQAGGARLTTRLLDRGHPEATVSAQLPWPLAGARVDSVDLRLGAPALDLARLAPLLPPQHALAGRLAMQAHVHGALPVDLAARIEDGTLDPARDLDLVVDGELRLDGVMARLADGAAIDLDATAVVTGTSRSPVGQVDLALAGDLGHLDLQARARPDSLTAQATLDLRIASDVVRPYLPLEQQPLLPRGVLAISGQVTAAGPPLAPWAAGDLRLAVVDEPELEPLWTAVTLLIGGRDERPPALVGDRAGWRAGSLRLNLRLLDADTELLRLSALAPLPHLAAAADSADMRLDAPELDLARLAPLLPAGTTITGRLEAATRVAGLMTPGQLDPDLALSGRLQVSNLRAQLPEGSRIALRGRIDLAGTSLAPQIRGGLHVEGGLIRLPDPPPTLLPATGEALLWQAATEPAPESPLSAETPRPVGSPPTATDTAPGPGSVAAPPTAAAVPRVLPDLVLTVTSPGGLWLRGQGLDVELAGDVSLLLRGDSIAVEGELQAIQGTMRQLGHIFRLEHGRVVFDGSETELNPELDLVLGVRVGQYQIRIQLGGTALVPALRFTSEPELSEADILATLLFGKPLEELDEGQTGLLASRAAQIAAAYGSSRLQESLARQLGVDVVSIAPREGDEETTALTVGKYLSPRVMVRYEQLLREGSAFFVHLDYAFAGTFRLHTQVSQGEESGVQLKWQRDW